MQSLIGILIILVSVIFRQGESITVRNYSKKYGNGGLFFNAIICFFSVLYFVFAKKGAFYFPDGLWILCVPNAFMAALGFAGAYFAFKWGSFALTGFFISVASFVPAFYGIIALGEKTTIWTYMAFSFLLVSMLLINLKKGEKKKLSLKWIISITLGMIGNGLVGILGRMQFEVFGDGVKNEFMMVSFGGAALLLFVMAVIFERHTVKQVLRYSLGYGVLTGVCNAVKNSLILGVYNYLAVSFVSPFNAALTMLSTFGISIFFYKEKFTKVQLAGLFLGILAVVFLNLK